MARIKPYTWHDYKKSRLPIRHCDSVVDDTDFKKTLQQERDFALQEGNAPVQGVFDYPDGGVDKSRTPTQLEMSMRSGELDKADISTVERALAKQTSKEAQDSAKKSKADKDAKIFAARQEFLDSQSGFDSSKVE